MEKRLRVAEYLFYCLCIKRPKAKLKEDLSKEARYLYQEKKWRAFWQRIGDSVPDFREKTVVDYGCGEGYDSLLMLQAGAKHVYCLEISKSRLQKAQQLHRGEGFSNASYIDNSVVSDLRKNIGNTEVDFVCCRDVMEHVPDPLAVLQSMYDVLKRGGKAYIGFSPIFKSPFGPHIRSKCRIPWIHLIFSEETIINVLKKRYNYSTTVMRYLDIGGSGVNKLSFYEYRSMLSSFAWDIGEDQVNFFPERPVLSRTLRAAVALSPFRAIKELFIVSSYVALCKNMPCSSPRE
jgi:2-polyprenyl-3-methyl-5-hydroxy-6-metoxy-1,4-benzoquinol methylase